MSKAVVPISGGLDSSVILSLAAGVHDEIYALTYDYKNANKFSCQYRRSKTL